MCKWTTQKQRDTLILRNPKFVWIESYNEKDRVDKEFLATWTEEEKEWYYIFNGLYNHGYYPEGCVLNPPIPPRMIKEMQAEAKHRKQTDIYENGMRESEEKIDREEWSKWVKEYHTQADIIDITAGDNLSQHRGIEYAINIIAKQLQHLDGTFKTETDKNLDNLVKIVAHIVGEERTHRGKFSMSPLLSLYKKDETKELNLHLRPSEIEGTALTEAGRLLKLHSFAECISCLLYTSPSPRDRQKSRMPSSA